MQYNSSHEEFFIFTKKALEKYFHFHKLYFTTTQVKHIFILILNMNCTKCCSNKTIKYGHWREGSQRMLCKSCNSTFTSNWKRGTYSQEFIQKIVHLYCHTNLTAREILDKYHISSRTLIKRSKKYTPSTAICLFCK